MLSRQLDGPRDLVKTSIFGLSVCSTDCMHKCSEFNRMPLIISFQCSVLVKTIWSGIIWMLFCTTHIFITVRQAQPWWKTSSITMLLAQKNVTKNIINGMTLALTPQHSDRTFAGSLKSNLASPNTATANILSPDTAQHPGGIGIKVWWFETCCFSTERSGLYLWSTWCPNPVDKRQFESCCSQTPEQWLLNKRTKNFWVI